LAALYSEELLNKDAGRKVLSLLTEARLVTVGVASDHRQQMVEIAHEALVRRWPRLRQWLEEDREILVWCQRLASSFRNGNRPMTAFFCADRCSMKRDFGCLDVQTTSRRQKRSSSTQVSAFNIGNARTRAIGRFELLVDISGSELEKQHAHSVGEQEAERLAKDLPFLARPGAQVHSLRSRLPDLPIHTVLRLLSAAAPADLTGDHPDDSSRDVEAAQKLDDQTFALLKSLQLQGASGLALELISPQLDGISDPNARLKFTLAAKSGRS
jgi:hypothetical protein